MSRNRLEDIAVQVLVEGQRLDGWLGYLAAARRPLGRLREVSDGACPVEAWVFPRYCAVDEDEPADRHRATGLTRVPH
jgi:hypothetical protein